MKIKAEVVPGDLSDGRLVQADRRCEVWLRGVNRHTGHVLVIARPALLNLRKRQNKIVDTFYMLLLNADPSQQCRNISDRCVWNKNIMRAHIRESAGEQHVKPAGIFLAQNRISITTFIFQLSFIILALMIFLWGLAKTSMQEKPWPEYFLHLAQWLKDLLRSNQSWWLL